MIVNIQFTKNAPAHSVRHENVQEMSESGSGTFLELVKNDPSEDGIKVLSLNTEYVFAVSSKEE